MTPTASINGVPVWRPVGASPIPSAETAPPDVVIVGGGPVGLTLALDLGRRGHRITLVNKLNFVAAGSKAICFAKRTLDIWDRLGVGEAAVAKGVVWDIGKVFWGEELIYAFEMLPVKHQKMPGFVNLQQYHAEEILLDAVAELPNVDVRWGHEVVGTRQGDEGVTLSIRTESGDYDLQAGWVLACDGSRSPMREMLGLDFAGRVFEDNFLIADIKMKDPKPAERWFWFDPLFNRGKSALLHQQPDDVWRLDFQLGLDIDRQACVEPKNVAPLVKGMLGDDIEFQQEWYSVYTFQCRRMARFVHDRVIFAGDSAHLVSPFGARGCNGGVADADNLAWKLDLVLKGASPEGLIESYDYEATVTADENIENSSRATDFMSPITPVSRAFRDAVLELAHDHAFARPFVNSGRLSTAVAYPNSPLNTPDEVDSNWMGVATGSVGLDAPIADGWLLNTIAGKGFVLLTLGVSLDPIDGVRQIKVEELGDVEGLVQVRYDLKAGAAYLIRPDQYIAARWRQPSRALVIQALNRAKGLA